MSWFEIVDVKEFVNNTRVLTYNLFEGLYDGMEAFNVNEVSYKYSDLTDEEKDELDSLLTYEECVAISEEYIVKEEEEYTINEDRYLDMIEGFNQRLISNMVQKLARDGALEIAFDDEKNDFVFWVNRNGKD